MNSLQFLSTQVDKVIGQQPDWSRSRTQAQNRNLPQRSSPLSRVVEEDEKDQVFTEKHHNNLQGTEENGDQEVDCKDELDTQLDKLGQDTQSRTLMQALGYVLFYIPNLISQTLHPAATITAPAYIDSSQLQLQSPHEKKRDNRHRRTSSVASSSSSSLTAQEKDTLASMRRESAASTMGSNSHTVFLPPPRPLLSPRLGKARKMTLVLDLDETLIHSVSRGSKFSASQMVEVKLDNQLATLYFVNKRPHCDEFLTVISQWYRLVIFTASVQAYADPMIDWLEKEGKYFSGRYYREHCTPTSNGGYIKDLTKITNDLSSVIIIDNSPLSYSMHQRNAISIEGWVSDPSDHSLLYLLPILQALRYCIDVRSFLGLTMGEESFDY